MKDLLEFIVTGIVENPKQIKINQSSEEDREVLTLSVAPSDMGKVIGKNGQIIRALRTLLRTCALKRGTKVQLQLLEEPKI